MKVVVFGAGAVGSFWGGLLARAGHDVRFIARGAQLAALETHGLRIASNVLGEVTINPVRAAAAVADGEPADLVLLSVKTHQTASVLEDLSAVVTGRTVVMALQNGVEADDLLRTRWGDNRVLSTVVYVGASIESPGVVRHVARGLLLVGNPYGVPAERYAEVLDALAAPGLTVRAVADIHRERWYKLMWNTSFNAVSALTIQTSRPLLDEPAARTVIDACMREVAAVARARGINLADAEVDRSLAETEKLPPIRTSMLEDREHGRQMEVEALVGAVVRFGRDAGVATPVTSTLYGLLKGMRPAPPALPNRP